LANAASADIADSAGIGSPSTLRRDLAAKRWPAELEVKPTVKLGSLSWNPMDVVRRAILRD